MVQHTENTEPLHHRVQRLETALHTYRSKVDQLDNDLHGAREIIYLLTERLGGRVEIADTEQAVADCTLAWSRYDDTRVLECIPAQVTDDTTLPCGHTHSEAKLSRAHASCDVPQTVYAVSWNMTTGWARTSNGDAD